MGRRHRAQEPHRGPRSPQPAPPGNHRRPAPAGFGPPPQPPPGKRRRVFLWVFLAVQIVFLVWAAVDVVLGIAYGVYRLAARRT